MTEASTSHVYRDDSDSDGNLSVDSWSSFDQHSSRSGSSSEDSDNSDSGNGNGQGRGTGRVRGRGGRQQRGRGRVDDGNNWNWRPASQNDGLSHEDWLGDYVQETGVRGDMSNFEEIDFFKLFFPEEAMVLIVEETNRYAEAHFQDTPTPLRPKSRKKAWKPIDNVDLSGVIGLLIAMGMTTKAATTDYWDTNYTIGHTPNFSAVMGRNKFQLIMSFLHFCNNAERLERNHPDYDPLFKIKALMDIVFPTYQQHYIPGRELAIDESMVAFKGRIGMKQYLPAKPTKWGFKLFVLADSNSHFCLKAVVYTGKEHFLKERRDTDADELVGTKVVLALMEGFEDRNHVVFCDSAYTSPELFMILKRKRIGATGTIGENRRNYPQGLKKKNLKMKKGDPPAFRSTDDILAVTWHDTKRVSLISSVSNTGVTERRIRSKGEPTGYRTRPKPDLVESYNKKMGGVDHFDQISGNYSFPHRSYKWYLPLFHFMVETALVNGFICMKTVRPNSSMRAKQFRQVVSTALCKESVTRKQKSPVNPPAVTPQSERLTGRHFIEQYTNKKYRPDCTVCKTVKKRRQTSYFCPDCSKPLCPVPCFRLYHTIERYEAARRRLETPQAASTAPPEASTSN